MMKCIYFPGITIAALALLSACGGSSSSSSTTDTSTSGTTNSSPVVDAGTAKIVGSDDFVTLSASASDSDSDTLTYSWAQTSGTAVELFDAATLTPNFYASGLSATQDLVFTLTVSDGTASVTDSVTVTVVDTSEGFVKQSLLSTDLASMELVSCTLNSGADTYCYELVFPANTVGSVTTNGGVGPFCAATTSTPRSEAGFGVYDGATNPGFLPILDAALAMETDGYDIIDEAGNIYIDNPGSTTSTTPDGSSACLEAAFDDSLNLTFIVPAIPSFASSNYTVQSVGNVGVGLNGIPMKGVPPSVINGPSMGGGGGTYTPNIPSLDQCGGHPDPAGYYHWHFIAQATNSVLASDQYNYTEQFGIECGNLDIAFDDPGAFSGYAQDGYPIYGALDLVAGSSVDPNTVEALDECNGHTHATAEFTDGAYHYHALEDAAPNMLTCLKGDYSQNFQTTR